MEKASATVLKPSLNPELWFLLTACRKHSTAEETAFEKLGGSPRRAEAQTPAAQLLGKVSEEQGRFDSIRSMEMIIQYPNLTVNRKRVHNFWIYHEMKERIKLAR